MRFSALFVVICCALVVTSATLAASAQTIRVGNTIERREGFPQGRDARTINWDDCQAGDTGDELSIALTVTVPSSLSLEIWAGVANCTSDITRTIPSNIPDFCWQVASFAVAQTGFYSLPVRDIVPHGGSGSGSGLADACSTAASTPSASGTVSLFFLLMEGNASVGTGSTLSLKYDLRGPDAPAVSSVAPGDAQLSLAWASPWLPSDLEHYQIYCEPADPTDPALCTSLNLSPGQPVSSASPRAQASNTATSGVAEGLINDVRYACGVAAFDAFGNAGPLSELLCAAPKVGAGPELTGRCQLCHAPITPGTSVTLLTLLGCLARRRARARAR